MKRDVGKEERREGQRKGRLAGCLGADDNPGEGTARTRAMKPFCSVLDLEGGRLREPEGAWAMRSMATTHHELGVWCFIGCFGFFFFSLHSSTHSRTLFVVVCVDR